MLFTAEVRWFWEGPLPATVADLFASADLSLVEPHDAGLVGIESPRIDTYVRLPGSEVVGVKYRQGLFEIKAQRAPALHRQLSARSSGLADGWCKISVTSGEFAIGSLWPEDLREVRHVRKVRCLRRYVVEEAVRSVPVAQVPGRGCNLEITEVQLVSHHDPALAASVGAPFHSLAFEGFGAAEKVAGLRDRALAQLLPLIERAPLALDAAHSLSYPAWLARQP